MLSRRIFYSAVFAIACLVFLARPAAADEASKMLEGVRWAGPAVTLDGLRGKTVVVLDYATWCPICNKWSPDLCKQLKEAIADRPVVVLAIDTDEESRNALKYMSDRGFFAPNIIHGHDHSIIKRADLPELWGYAIIGPSGKLLTKGHAGTFHEEGGEKKFTLAEDIARSKNLGEFMAIAPKMDDVVKQILWPFELGIAAGPSSAARKRLPSAEQKQLDAAMNKYMSKELDRIQELAKGELDDQFSAYDRAAALVGRFKSSSQAKDARKVALSLEGDAKFKRELLAKRAYEKCAQSSADAKRKSTAMKTLAKRFPGTEYGEKAKTAGDEGG
jgi:thiol-disulfide isomerase/thioredoxin